MTTFALGQSVRDPKCHDASKREWVGRIIEAFLTVDVSVVLYHVEWSNGSRSWIVGTRLEAV